MIITFDPATLPEEIVFAFIDNRSTPNGSWDQQKLLTQAVYGGAETGHKPYYEDALWAGELSLMNPNPLKGIPRSMDSIMRLYERNNHVVRITPAIIPAFTTSYSLKSFSEYEHHRNNRGGRKRSKFPKGTSGIAQARDVKKFLQDHVGKSSFVDFW